MSLRPAGFNSLLSKQVSLQFVGYLVSRITLKRKRYLLHLCYEGQSPAKVRDMRHEEVDILLILFWFESEFIFRGTYEEVRSTEAVTYSTYYAWTCMVREWTSTGWSRVVIGCSGGLSSRLVSI